MKKKAVVLGLVGAMALGTCTVSAANGTKNISATFRNIKIVVDGKQVSTSAEPFIYNGTTYLPIRAVGEAVGKEVSWDAGTNTVYLGEVPASAQQPATPAPAATGSLMILTQSQYGEIAAAFVGVNPDELPAFIAAVRSGDESAHILVDLYCETITLALANGNKQAAMSLYAEGQAVLASATNNPDYADAKAWFEEIWQSDFLPNL